MRPGLGLRRKGDYDKAIADYTEAIRLNPKLAEAYYSRGFAYGKKGDYDKAIADYTEAIRLDPKYAEAYYNRGVAYATRATTTRRLPTTPRPSGWTRNMPRRIATGALPTGEGRYDKAIADYTEAIRLNPEYADGVLQPGHRLQEKGDEDKAEADFDQAKRLGYKPHRVTPARKQRRQDAPVIEGSKAPFRAPASGTPAVAREPASARASAGQGTQLVPVSSSALRAVGYDDSREILEIQFNNGAVYRYYGVPRRFIGV